MFGLSFLKGVLFLGIICSAFFFLFIMPWYFEWGEWTWHNEIENESSTTVSEFEYTYPDFVCGDFSDELTSKLKERGWFAWKETVDVPQERCPSKPCLHSIVVVAVPIDAVDGTILTPELWEERGYSWLNATDCDRCLRVVQG